MRVLLISANREEINMRTLPLGLACVAAAAKKKGHDVALMDLMEEGNPSEAVQRILGEFRPEAIGISVRNIDDQKMDSSRFLTEKTNLLFPTYYLAEGLSDWLPKRIADRLAHRPNWFR